MPTSCCASSGSRPDFGTGAVDVVGGINLTDPDATCRSPLTRPTGCSPAPTSTSSRSPRAKDGTYWIGDEFGPYLLHFDRAGRLLQAPMPLPGVFAPENPAAGDPPTSPAARASRAWPSRPTAARSTRCSRARSPATRPATCGSTSSTSGRNSYTGRRWTYPLEPRPTRSATRSPSTRDRFLIIERDNGQGDTAKFKRIYLADKRDRNHDGMLDKTLVADLMNIANPRAPSAGSATTFTFPFQTIEDVVILDDRTLAVVNDNNFPFSAGRTAGRPDNNEFIVIRLDRHLDADKRVLRRY